MTHHPAPWWYRLLSRLFPSRCREIPEAANPDRIVLRQFAVLKRYWYLQQFSSGEDPRFMHSHPYRFMLAIGLWGSYTEHRIAGRSYRRKAPYFFVLDGSHVHHVQDPSPGHTSLFLGFGRAKDGEQGDKRYYGVPEQCEPMAEGEFGPKFSLVCNVVPLTFWSPWERHIQKKVERI